MNAKAAAPEAIPEAPDTGETLGEFRGRQIDVLMAHARHLAEQIAELLLEMRRMKRALDLHVAEEETWQRGIDAKLDMHTTSLAANTAITQEIAERKAWWAGLKARLGSARGWLIGIASTIAATVGAWLALAEALGRKGPPTP